MMLFQMKRYLLVILMLIYGNSYANSDYSADDYSYQDILKYREMINKIPEDKFLKNTVPSVYLLPAKINETVSVRPSDIILKNDNTVTVWFTQKILKEEPSEKAIFKAGDKLKQQFRIDCYDYSAAFLNNVLYRGEKVVFSKKNPNPTFDEIIPQSVLAVVASKACMFQTVLERKKMLTD